jgi:hypothetical protein
LNTRKCTDKESIVSTILFRKKRLFSQPKNEQLNIEISTYNSQLSSEYQAICNALANQMDAELEEATSKIWHAHPVWFLDGNPIVGYSKQKPGIRLMFWSGADFDEVGLIVRKGKFKDASVFYNDVAEIDVVALNRWLKKSRDIQWDYQHIVKNKGKLERLK